MNQIQAYNLRFQIIKNTLLYLDGKKDLKEAILSDLKTLANAFHVKVSKVAKIDCMRALIQFVDYTPDAINSINKLYNSF